MLTLHLQTANTIHEDSQNLLKKWPSKLHYILHHNKVIIVHFRGQLVLLGAIVS